MIAECARGQFAALVFSLVAYLVASPGVRAQEAPDYAALVVAPDRSDADWKPASAAIQCRFLPSRAAQSVHTPQESGLPGVRAFAQQPRKGCSIASKEECDVPFARSI